MGVDRSTLRAFALATQMGFSIAVPLVAGVAGGLFLDDRLGTEPIFLIVGILLGLVLATFTLYKLVSFRTSRGSRNGT